MRILTTFACLALCSSSVVTAAQDIHPVGATQTSELRVRKIASPSADHALYPWLDYGPGRGLSASWTERLKDGGTRMMWSQWSDGKWTAAEEIVRGNNWFVNWADHPVHAADANGNAVASWLGKVAGSPYAYHALVKQRDGQSGTWGAEKRLHSDASAGEHGFVSLDRAPSGDFMAVWLDGRNTGDGGAMQLWARRIDSAGLAWGPETLLDERVCDCCSTSLRIDVNGAAMVAFRDRSPLEVRDISWMQLPAASEASWTAAPRGNVFADHWTIAGCPVNGPAQALLPGASVVAWFTAANSENLVRLSVRRLTRKINPPASATATETAPSELFAFPQIVAAGNTVLGRVSVAARKDLVLVSWLMQGQAGTSWMAQLYRVQWQKPTELPAQRSGEQAPGPGSIQLHKLGEAVHIAKVGGGRVDGFLRLAPTAEGWMACWTDGESKQLACAEISLVSASK